MTTPAINMPGNQIVNGAGDCGIGPIESLLGLTAGRPVVRFHKLINLPDILLFQLSILAQLLQCLTLPRSAFAV